MQQLISFLEELAANNNREWFQTHKATFKECQTRFTEFVGTLIREIAKTDASIAGLAPEQCIYRIYRDVRFSKDKSPYKTHFGAYINRGGKHSGYSGYYFQVGVPSADPYTGHWLAVGDYCCQPQVLRTLREDIAYGGGDFEDTLRQAPTFTLDTSQQLTRLPKGFAADTPYPDYVRLKSFCLLQQLDAASVCDAHLAQHLAALFATAQPFLAYINRAVAYVHEG